MSQPEYNEDEHARRLREATTRGDHAETLINDWLIKETLQTIKEKITKEWQEADAGDEKVLKRCKDRLESFQLFELYLQAVLRDGENAKKDLLKLDPSSRLRRVIKR